MRYPLLYILIYLFIVVFVDFILYLLILISLYLSDIVILISIMIQRNLKQVVPYSLTLLLCRIFILELLLRPTCLSQCKER